MLDRLLLDHPRSIGESYVQHQREAMSFAAALLSAALACGIHAVIPALFQSTGSRTVRRLHDQMVRRVERSVDLAAADQRA
jgi:hypothetical protein